MDFVTLNNGVKMPMIGFGVYQIPNNETARCVLNAIEAGYRSIDKAHVSILRMFRNAIRKNFVVLY